MKIIAIIQQSIWTLLSL